MDGRLALYSAAVFAGLMVAGALAALRGSGGSSDPAPVDAPAQAAISTPAAATAEQLTFRVETAEGHDREEQDD